LDVARVDDRDRLGRAGRRRDAPRERTWTWVDRLGRRPGGALVAVPLRNENVVGRDLALLFVWKERNLVVRLERSELLHHPEDVLLRGPVGRPGHLHDVGVSNSRSPIDLIEDRGENRCAELMTREPVVDRCPPGFGHPLVLWPQ